MPKDRSDKARKTKVGPLPPEPVHPVNAANWYADRWDKEFIIEVGTSVPWYAFKDEVPLDLFGKLRKLAMFDLYTNRTPSQIRIDCGLKTVEQLDELRTHPTYPRVVEAIELAMEDAAKERTPEEWVERGTDKSFRRMYQRSVWSRSAREGDIAAREFVDRAMPKVQRQQIQDDRRTVHLPDALVELLAETINRRRELADRKVKEIGLSTEKSGVGKIG